MNTLELLPIVQGTWFYMRKHSYSNHPEFVGELFKSGDKWRVTMRQNNLTKDFDNKHDAIIFVQAIVSLDD